MVVLTLCSAGDHIVAASTLYGGTISQLAYTFPRLGIETTFVDPGDQGLIYAELEEEAFITKARSQILRDLGACQAPFNAWLTILGIETLSLRMDRHVHNTQLVAEFLEGHPAVEWVSYPGLQSHPDHEKAQKYLPKGPGGILGFGIAGGREAGERFINTKSAGPPPVRNPEDEEGNRVNPFFPSITGANVSSHRGDGMPGPGWCLQCHRVRK